jgi:transposase
VISMDSWETIRLRHRNGEKIKPLARELGMSPRTVRKYILQGHPPKRADQMRPSRLDIYRTHIDDLLRSTPKITAVRIGSYLRQNVDHELAVGESALRAYVAARRCIIQPKEAFIRARYGPGDQAQFDFSPMTVLLAGVETIVQLFVVRLSYSGRIFARTSIRQDRPSLFAGLLAAFTTFGGLPRCAVFDNASTAVTRALRGRKRTENDEFAAFRGALALRVEFAAPAKGNEKGGVEGIHGFVEDNFFRPMPAFASLDELNVALAAFCQADLARTAAGHQESIGERFTREAAVLYSLPAVLPRACITYYARINKFAEVCFERNWYSVPERYAHRHAQIEVYEDRLRIIVDTDAVAEHRRAIGHGQKILDYKHYLGLLQRKHRAAASAEVLADGRIPAELRELFEHYCRSDVATATKKWTQVLALLADASAEQLAQTVTRALARGTDDPAAIAMLLRQSIDPPERRVLDLRSLPAAARVLAPVVDLTAYATAKLMEGAA